jgi:deoxyadenosine/deoxycytidine kinase
MKNPRISLVAGLGVGKTTLARHLEQDHGFKAILEDPSSVKAQVARLGKDAPDGALVNELLFLEQRRALLAEGFAHDGPVVFDTDLLVEKIWGDLTIKDPVRQETFGKIYDFFENHLPQPDLKVYLTCDPQIQLKRIQGRGREYEQGITLEFLRELATTTARHIDAERQKQNVLVIDTTNLDLARNWNDAEQVTRQIFEAAPYHPATPKSLPGYYLG